MHPTAEVHPSASLGAGVVVWNWTKVREGARIGATTRLGQCVYVDRGVVIGAGCKVQNGVSVYAGVTISDRVLVGPNATFTNDRRPRAFVEDWEVSPTFVGEGASIGANATIVCGVSIGAYAMVAAGAVVTRDVPPHALVVGTPARLVDFVDATGRRLHHDITGTPPSPGLLARADDTRPANGG